MTSCASFFDKRLIWVLLKFVHRLYSLQVVYLKMKWEGLTCWWPANEMRRSQVNNLQMKWEGHRSVTCKWNGCRMVTWKWIQKVVDVFLYFGTTEKTCKKFELEFGSRFHIEFQGKAHWYLAARISQDKDINITIDQFRSAKSIVRCYLYPSGVNKTTKYYTSILPATFFPSKNECSADEWEARKLQDVYNIDYSSSQSTYSIWSHILFQHWRCPNLQDAENEQDHTFQKKCSPSLILVGIMILTPQDQQEDILYSTKVE